MSLGGGQLRAGRGEDADRRAWRVRFRSGRLPVAGEEPRAQSAEGRRDRAEEGSQELPAVLLFPDSLPTRNRDHAVTAQLIPQLATLAGWYL